MKIGDTIPVRFVGLNWPECHGTVTSLDRDGGIDFTYHEDAGPVAGLRGYIRPTRERKAAATKGGA